MKSIISILMSLLLLLSSAGITYAQHFCGEFEMMAKITLGQEKMTCGMVVEDACGDEQEGTHTCCDNQYAQIATDDNFATSQSSYQITPVFAASFVSIFVLQSQPLLKSQQPEVAFYYPPPLIKDLPVLYETFLI